MQPIISNLGLLQDDLFRYLYNLSPVLTIKLIVIFYHSKWQRKSRQ